MTRPGPARNAPYEQPRARPPHGPPPLPARGGGSPRRGQAGGMAPRHGFPPPPRPAAAARSPAGSVCGLQATGRPAARPRSPAASLHLTSPQSSPRLTPRSPQGAPRREKAALGARSQGRGGPRPARQVPSRPRSQVLVLSAAQPRPARHLQRR